MSQRRNSRLVVAALDSFVFTYERMINQISNRKGRNLETQRIAHTSTRIKAALAVSSICPIFEWKAIADANAGRRVTRKLYRAVDACFSEGIPSLEEESCQSGEKSMTNLQTLRWHRSEHFSSLLMATF